MATISASFATRIGGLHCRLQNSKSNLTFFPGNLSSISVLLKHSSSTMSANSLQVNAIDAPSEELEALSRGNVGENDLLIVGPGVLGRLVAEKWREEHPGCQIYGQTVTTDHHDELIKMGIIPSSKQTKLTYKFPYVIFCAPPSQTEDYAGDIREAALNWNGKGSFLFTSSSAPYDCFDNGEINEDGPVVPIGRSPRTDVLLKAEKVVLDFDGCVVRLAGLYISFITCFSWHIPFYGAFRSSLFMCLP